MCFQPSNLENETTTGGMGQVTKESADTLSLADDIYIEETGLVMFHYLVIQSDLLEMVK